MALSKARSRAHNASTMTWLQVVMTVATAALLMIGYVVVYSSSQASILAAADVAGTLDSANAGSKLMFQVLYSFAGAALAFCAWRINPDFWRGIPLIAVCAGAMVLLVATFVAGTSALGATRWLSLGPISLQPSEFAKIAFVLLACRLADKYLAGEFISTQRFGLTLAVVVGLPLFFLYKSQSDLGTTIIIVVAFLAIAWLAGMPWKVFRWVLVALAVFGFIAIFGTGYRTDRMVVYDPWNDGDGGYGNGYQTIHSFYAFAQGGLFGVGLGNSTEKFDYLPEAETDFVFSIIGEEFGMLGALIVIALFMVLLYCGLRIAHGASTPYGTMLAGSCTIMLVFQAFLNMGCVIGVVPTTGKPLPFISYGGSSVIASLILVGLILSVAHASDDDESVYERRRANLRVVRALDGEDDVAHEGSRRRRSRFAEDASGAGIARPLSSRSLSSLAPARATFGRTRR